MQKFLCLICLRELSTKKSAKNHLRTAHNETNEENIESFDIDYVNIEVKENAEGNASVPDREEIERAQALDRWFHDNNNTEKFCDIEAMLNQELLENQEIGPAVDIDFIGEDEQVLVNKKKESKSKQKNEKIQYFQPLTNCFNNSNLMESFHLYKKKSKKNKSTVEVREPTDEPRNKLELGDNVELRDNIELDDNIEPGDNNEPWDNNLINVNQGSVNESDAMRSSALDPKLKRKFTAPYKQKTKGKGTVCDLDGCSFCGTKSDCGQCEFDLNKAKL